MIDITDKNFETEVLKSKVPVLVDFWAPWCVPCRIITPILAEVLEQYKGKLKICRLNVEDAHNVAVKYAVMSLPTLNIYKDGEHIDQVIGTSPNYKSKLISKCEEIV